jgi:hypothetical protein
VEEKWGKPSGHPTAFWRSLWVFVVTFDDRMPPPENPS